MLHVNGDDPEAVDRVARVAAAYRAEFGGDILIDLVCYRRPGHNEIDEPRFTHPVMYQAIDARPPVHQLYADTLARRGLDTSAAETAAAQVAQDMRSRLRRRQVLPGQSRRLVRGPLVGPALRQRGRHAGLHRDRPCRATRCASWAAP